MAELKENLIRLGYLPYSDMLEAIENGDLTEYCICYTSDTHEQFLIKPDLTPLPIKSKMNLFGSEDAAIEYANTDSSAYDGQVISVRVDDVFKAYIINSWSNGTKYISPIITDQDVNYNDILNAPIKNLEGTVANPIVLADLEDGFYKISGRFIAPGETETKVTLVGNYVIVDVDFEVTYIKRVTRDSIFDYVITSSGTTTKKYVTDEYLRANGYKTESEIATQIEAYNYVTNQTLVKYVSETCELLISHMIDEKLDQRACTKEEIESLF